MNRVYNFCPGPCTLPLSVLEEAQSEFVNYQNAGMSIIEMSHRGKHFMEVHENAISLIRSVYKVPADFSVLFVQGGATMQFAMLPMNLLSNEQKGAYINTGTWAKGAITDAKQVANIYVPWDGESENYARMPNVSEYSLEENTRYLHITSNETIGGIRYAEFPDVDVPLVADMSSDFMSREIDWNKFDVVYGGVQKNLGPSGMSIVIIRNSVLEQSNQSLPRYLRYDIHQSKDSMFNTPPVFPIYMVGKVMKWMESEGGIEAMEKNANTKSSLLYNALDNSGGFYRSPVDKACRSTMNVVFRLPTEELEAKFIADAAVNGLSSLKGHRSVGGCRASIYNAMPLDGVKALAEFMDDFATKNS